MEKLKVGFLGCGQFAQSFVDLFIKHPYVESVIVADTDPAQAKATGERFGVPYYHSLDELLSEDINAAAIFTPRHTHGPIAIRCLEAGKHVYSAVPMASEISHCEQIVRLVKKTHLTYMMGETCVYYPCSLYCKEKLASGDMGKFVYAESQYHHDISHFSAHHREDLAAIGIPPFYYPTHSISMVLAATGSYVTKVTAMGYEDTEDDPIFKKGVNMWDNVYSNAFSLMRLANGGVVRINECRRIGHKAPSSYISSFYGTTGGYQFSNAQHMFTKNVEGGVKAEDVSDLVNPVAMTENKGAEGFKNDVANHKWQWDSFSPMQDPARLPESYRDLHNGHMASHQFLIDDFCTAAYNGTLPTVSAWDAARYTVPGIVAYESLLKDGEPMDVPDFGNRPTDEEWAKPLPQLMMRHPALSFAADPVLPEGYAIRTHEAGMEAVWEDVIKDAFGHPYSFSFMKDRPEYDPKTVFYLEKDEEAIATATAVENPLYPGEGWFRMVGVRSCARGLGAGRLIASYALADLRRRGYKTALLSTDDRRIPAIALYLSLGFEPYITHESHEARWKAVMHELARRAEKKQ